MGCRVAVLPLVLYCFGTRHSVNPAEMHPKISFVNTTYIKAGAIEISLQFLASESFAGSQVHGWVPAKGRQDLFC